MNSFPFRCFNRTNRYSALGKCVHSTWPCTLSIRPGIDACTECARQGLMRTLIILISFSCMHVQHADQFSKFSNVHFVYPQHSREELMHALSLRLRNWCVRWAYASGADECMEHRSPKLVRALSAVPSKHADHTRQKPMCALSMHIRNWCPVHTHQFLTNIPCIRVKLQIWKDLFKTCWAYS